MRMIDYTALENNLQDLIAEEQVKLGYREEDIRLYYPMSSLRHLLSREGEELPAADEDEMQSVLEDFADAVRGHFGQIKVSHRKDRFCFHLPPEATRYVHEHRGENAFIYELVGLLSQHGTTMDDVKALFERQDAPCVAEDIDNEEFDVLIRFIDSPDRYYYCFRDEMVHIIYHRFLPEDYEDLYPS